MDDVNFTELNDHILNHLGWKNVNGLTVPELLAFVPDLYRELHPDDTTRSQPLFETEEWKSNLWEYLKTLPDFVIGPEDEGKQLTLDEIEALPLPPDGTIPDKDEDVKGESIRLPRRSSVQQSVQQMAAASKSPSPDVEPPEEQPGKLSFQPRVFASHDKIWRTIAGHPVDWVRLPPKEFEALCAISAAGKDGAMQPDVTKITGQDKKSLPRRTYALEAKGYIEKRPIISLKSKTMHLTNKKFVDEEMANGTHYTQVVAQPILLDDNLVPGSRFWTGTVIYEDALMRSMINLVGSWGVIDITRLKMKLGVQGSIRHKKLIRDRLSKFCHIGIFEEFLGQEPGSTKVSQCLKFLRQPTEMEWKTECERRPEPEIKPRNVASKSKKSKPKKKAKRSAKKRSSKAKALDIGDDCESEPEDETQDLEPGFEDETQDLEDQTQDPDNETQTQLEGFELETGKNDRTLDESLPAENLITNPVVTNDDASPLVSDQVAPIDSADVPAPKPPKRRGRPPKNKVTVVATNDVSPLSDQIPLNGAPEIPEPKLPKRRGRPPGRKDSAPRSTASRPKAKTQAEPLGPEEAVFTSYQDLQRNEGLPGVYINPSGSEYSTNNEEVLVAVFKTNLLKTWDPSRSRKEKQLQSVPVTQSVVGTDFAIAPSSLPRNNSLAAVSAFGLSQGTYQSPYTPAPTIATPATSTNYVSVYSSPYPNLAVHNTQASTDQISYSRLSPSQIPSFRQGQLDVVSEAAKLEPSLQDASNVDLPADTIFILALWNKRPGKLCLANDKKSVLFYAAETVTAPTIPALEIETSTILPYPKVSKTPPDRAEFRITCEDFEHTFIISASEEAILAADTLRAKMVTSLLAQSLTSNVKEKKAPPSTTPGDDSKPWQCEICLKRWRNDNGLLYHQTKSRSTCNPNWRPEEACQTSRRLSRHESLNPDILGSLQDLGNETPNAPSTPSIGVRVGIAAAAPEDREPPTIDDIFGDDSNQRSKRKRKAKSGSVEDSDFVPEEAFVSLEEPIAKRRKVKTPNGKERSSVMGSRTSTPTSTPTSRSAIDPDTDMDLDIDSDGGSVSPLPEIHPSPKRINKRKKVRAPVVPGSRQFIKNILMHLVVSNGGIFPGGKSLWVAIVGESQRRCPSVAYPERYIVQSTLKAMLNGRSLKRETCSFKTKMGLMAKYEVVSRPSTKPNPDALNELKNQIKEAWPGFYVPPPFNASESLIREVEKMEEKEKQKKSEVQVLDNPYYLEKAATRQSAVDQEDDLDAENSDKYLSEQEDVPDSLLPDADAVNSAEEQDMEVYQNGPYVREEYEREEETTPAPMFFQDPVTGLWDAPPAQVPVTAKKKRKGYTRRVQLPEVVTYMQSTFFQDPVTGFWDALPAHIPVTEQKMRKKYTRMVLLPEVITYMQSYHDPTWSHQPFGHGARPLYARPGRRVEGNPLTDKRLLKLQDGHRPIIEPRHKMIAPARPSKLIFNSFRPFSDEDFARNYDASLLPAKRRKLAKEREVEEASRGRKKCARDFRVHIPHQRPASMKSLPIVIPPTVNYSADSILFLSPNTHLGDEENGEVLEYTASSLKGRSKPNRRPYRLDWNGGEALNWFNPPWELEEDYEAEYEKAMQPRQIGRPRLTEPKPIVQLKHFKTRKLTHLKTDFEKQDDMTGVPIANFVDPPAGKRGRKVGMSPEMENRFVVTHVAIYTIGGGVGKVVDIVLVARLFPNYTLKKLRDLWFKIKKRRGKEIPIIEARFQEAFLKGYEAGLFPALDYDDLLNYDWAFVIDWYMAKHPVVSGGLENGLPASRSSLLEKYEIADMESTENWQDLFVGTSSSVSKAKRHQLSCKDHLTMALHPAKSKTPSLDKAAIAVSVVRANIGTPIESYNADIAKAKLLKIGETAVASAKAQLIESKSISHKNRGRAIPGQPYILSETYYKPLQRQPIKVERFAEARKYKQELDAAFRRGESVKLDRKEDDGAFMCVTNLLANGRIRLVQSKVPLSKFGLLQNTYETNTINKNQLLFVLDIIPTKSYLYNDQLNLSFKPPRGVGDSIPAWFDINGNLLPGFWQKSQEAVFACLALRPGITVAELAKTFSPALMDWELRLVVDWGTDVHALRRFAGDHEGWTTGEWWWMIPGMRAI